MHKAFKFQLKPTADQQKTLNQWVGCTRKIWNWALEENQKQYANNKTFIFRYDLKRQLPQLKQEMPYLAEVPSQALQNRVLDFDKALVRSFKGFGFPKYKSKHNEADNTLRIDQTNNHIVPKKKQIKVPKMGWVKWVKHRPLEGKLKHITIKRENNHWWCVVLCELPDPIQQTEVDDLIGIDLGLITTAVCSNGYEVPTPKYYRKAQKKLKRAQRRLSNRHKGTNRRIKAKQAVNQAHFKVKCQRSDFIHKATTAITKQNCFVGLEDLNIKGMAKRWGKSIYDQGLGQFVSQIEYKCQRGGGFAIKVDRYFPSTQECICGETNKIPLGQRTYSCSFCGLSMNRDLKAAIKIKEEALRLLKTESRYGIYRIDARGDSSAGHMARDICRYGSENREKFQSLGLEATEISPW